MRCYLVPSLMFLGLTGCVVATPAPAPVSTTYVTPAPTTSYVTTAPAPYAVPSTVYAAPAAPATTVIRTP